MHMKQTHVVPKSGFKGLVENWRSDFLAAISVSLVALPLGLGVAVASGAPPISGLTSAIIGGVVVTLFRGSHLAINGPAAGLIAVLLAGLVTLDDGSDQVFAYLLAATCIAGILQVVLGFLKLGKIAEIIPSSVIRGVMVAIGIIIISSQIHVALGTHTDAKNPIDKLMDVFTQLPNINPVLFLISALGIFLLVVIPKIKGRLFQFFPASLWVLLLSIPFVYLFDFFTEHQIEFLGKKHTISPDYLINIPEDLSQAIIFPNFEPINTFGFWIVVISITLIASIQTLAMAKAVDKLDPYKRKTNLDKDLIGMGIGTMVSAAIGGLPIITVIVRSTVNIHNNAKTKWSNFYHGLLLLVFLVLLAPVIQQVPLAALAAILVHIGFKLAAPKVFKQTYATGIEQVIFMVATIIITLYTDLLIGILVGTFLTFVVHLLLARIPIEVFFQMIFKPGSSIHQQTDGPYNIKIKGIANFMGILPFNKLIKNIPATATVNIDLSKTRLVGMTYFENIIDFLQEQDRAGGVVNITGLERHVSSSGHNRSLKIMNQPFQPKHSPRQTSLSKFAGQHGYRFNSQVDWNTSSLRNFQFFEIRPIERKDNRITGTYRKNNINWEIADVTFHEGASIADEIYHSTVQVVFLPMEIPKFVLEKEGIVDRIFDRIMAFSGYMDIDFHLYPNFSKQFLLMGENEENIRQFFTKELIYFLEHEEVYHIESNGTALLIFKNLKLARITSVSKILRFSEQLLEKIVDKKIMTI